MTSPVHIGSLSERDLARLQRSYRVDENGCWVCTLGRNQHGYARFKITLDGSSRTVVAHRASYVAFVGPIPDGLVLDHTCRNRACINPAHLEPVTQRENVIRSVPFNPNANKAVCDNGHPYTEANTYYPPNTSKRQCRTCIRNNTRRYRLRAAAKRAAEHAA